MKVSEFKKLLEAIPLDTDPEIVTGEVWLPERLINVDIDSEFVRCEFDTAPEDGQGDEEGRGFVDHEVELIRTRIMQIFTEKASLEHKQQAILSLILFAHENEPSTVIELLNDVEDE